MLPAHKYDFKQHQKCLKEGVEEVAKQVREGAEVRVASGAQGLENRLRGEAPDKHTDPVQGCPERDLRDAPAQVALRPFFVRKKKEWHTKA